MTSNNSTNPSRSTLQDFTFSPAKMKFLQALKDITLVFVFSVLTGISAGIKAGLGPVPFTLQTLAVILSGALLGKKKGAAAQLIYLAGGLSGLPWFSNGGGLAYILSPTFGYILGFPAAAFTAGYLTEKIKSKNFLSAIAAMAASSMVIYIPGLLWLTEYVGTPKVLSLGLYPFLFGDCLKSILGGLIYLSKIKVSEIANKLI